MKTHPSYCSSFREEAFRVWTEMSEAEKFNIARQEETITEDLLLNLARKHNGRGLKIKSFSKKEESANGADWAFWFSDGMSKDIGVRIQAKRLYKDDGRYTSLFHQSDTQKKSSRGTDTPNQCEVLLNHRDSLIPVYTFYNSDVLDISHAMSGHEKVDWASRCWFPYWSPEWGISAASPLAVKKVGWGRQRNRPGDFPMVPWHCLICPCCWESQPANSSLPSLIGHGLRQLYGTSGDDKEVADLGFDFEPKDNVPDWVQNLRAGTDGKNRLLESMEEMNLRGVAEIHESSDGEEDDRSSQ